MEEGGGGGPEALVKLPLLSLISARVETIRRMWSRNEEENRG